MRAYTTYKGTVAGNRLAEVMLDLPEELKTSELEVLIFPLKSDYRKEKPGLIKIDDLPLHNMGKVLSSLDRNSIYSDER